MPQTLGSSQNMMIFGIPPYPIYELSILNCNYCPVYFGPILKCMCDCKHRQFMSFMHMQG